MADEINATKLAKDVSDAVKAGTADEAMAASVAEEFGKMEPMQAYHFIVQVAGALREDRKHKDGLMAFNRLLAKHAAFNDAMVRLNEAKEKGLLAKPA